MIDNLIVLSNPGDELQFFYGLISTESDQNWDVVYTYINGHDLKGNSSLKQLVINSCKELGIRKVFIFPTAKTFPPLYSISSVAESLKKLGCYDRIFTYSVVDEDLSKQSVSLSVLLAYDVVYTVGIGGVSDIIICLNIEQFQQKILRINLFYREQITKRKGFKSLNITDVERFQRYKSVDLLKYYYLNYRLDVFDFSDDIDLNMPTLPPLNTTNTDPWELGTSDYEKERHDFELRILFQFEWSSLVEVGACEGFFTKKLIQSFPDKTIIATEPDTKYFVNLQKNVGDKITCLQCGINNVAEIDCDILFISSLMYYVKPFPFDILFGNYRYVIMSHNKFYHEKVLDQIMLSHGFKSIFQDDMWGMVEPMWGVLDIKEGTNIKVWVKND